MLSPQNCQAGNERELAGSNRALPVAAGQFIAVTEPRYAPSTLAAPAYAFLAASAMGSCWQAPKISVENGPW